MTSLRVSARDDKRVSISGIDSLVAACLYELPQILEQRDAPAAHDRLFPNPTDSDRKTNDYWQSDVAPGLRHLFLSAGEIVTRDLTAMQRPSPPSHLMQVEFPIEHVPAWITAINQARLILGALHDVTADDLSATLDELRTAKDHAVLQIHVLGYLLELFIVMERGESVGPP